MTKYNPSRLTTGEVQQITGFCATKVRNIAESGEVQTVNVGGIRLFNRKSLLVYLSNNYPGRLKAALYGEGGKA